MNKIHNNLTVENLIKTEWFNQFDKQQKEEILTGLEKNLNVSIYAKPIFSAYQMFEIREGLEANLNVNLYAKTEYNEHQMSQIRKGLKNNLDISSICKNFDETHKSCYYNLFKIPPVNIFKNFFK